MVIPGCEASDKSGAEFYFTDTLSTFGGLLPVYPAVLVHVVGEGFCGSHT